MFSATDVMQRISEQLKVKVRFSMWTNNEALVKRMTKLMDHNPMVANLKNDPDLYCGLKNSTRNIEIEEIAHVKGHQDETGKILNNVEKLNILTYKLAMRGVNKRNCDEPTRNKILGPLLRIDGKVITQKKEPCWA